jgi:hypothetical protein
MKCGAVMRAVYQSSTEGRSLYHAWAQPVTIKVAAFKGCTSYAQGKGGVCVNHGAKVKRNNCAASRDVTNYALRGGVCKTLDM